MLVGGTLAWVADHRLILGFGGYAAMDWEGCVSSGGFGCNGWHDRHRGPGEEPRLAYGGLVLGFNAMPRRAVDFYGGILVGGGCVRASEEEWAGAAADWRREEYFWTLEPQAMLLLKFSRFLQVGIGGSYRFVSGVESRWTSRARLQGAAGLLSIRLGLL
ncbi:MAG: hypothetical protein JXO51_05335 [Candidatus Aminicenantes bacterium]|nr:hypothetical protein [Candidatus Aminicenantes bacterium]